MLGFAALCLLRLTPFLEVFGVYAPHAGVLEYILFFQCIMWTAVILNSLSIDRSRTREKNFGKTSVYMWKGPEAELNSWLTLLNRQLFILTAVTLLTPTTYTFL